MLLCLLETGKSAEGMKDKVKQLLRAQSRTEGLKGHQLEVGAPRALSKPCFTKSYETFLNHNAMLSYMCFVT